MLEVNHSVTVGDVSMALDKAVILESTVVLRTAVEQASKKRQGIVCIVDDKGHLLGVFTDGDLRRLLLQTHKPIGAIFAEDIGDHMTPNPKCVTNDMSLEDAIVLMETADIYDLPVVDDAGKLIGLVHMHTALKYLLGL